ncbi:hypothetical protein Tco_0471940 [Tanacetum coccineum]
MPEDPYAYIMAAYEVPPSPDYIPGPEVPPSPDYIPGPEGPPSPDYVPGPEEPEQAPPSPVYLPYVPEPVYPEYIPPEDDVFLAEEQPLHAATSPTAESPGYIPESDPEEDPADYPADRDDDDDDEEEEEEEHPAPADFVPPVHRMTARISIRDEPSISLPPREEVERLLALTTPPPSPLTPLSSPLPQIPSPTPNSPTHIEIPESCLPLRKRVRFASPTPSREVGESSAAGAARQDRPTISRDDPYSIAREDLYGFVDMVDVPPRCSTSRELDYDITDTWDNLVGAIDEIARHHDRSQLRGRVNMLYRDRHVHRRLAVMIEREAKMAREAWGLSMDASDYARSDVMSLRTMVVAQSALISELQSADHRRQRVISELLDRPHENSLLSIMGYSQLVDYIDLLFCLATQYRSFVRILSTLYSILSITGISRLKMAPRGRPTRLNPDATPTPHVMQPEMAMIAIFGERVPAGPPPPVQVARECTYPDFLKCQPLNFKGTEGVVGLTQWFEKMESVYSISNCTVACQVKFATCTLSRNNAHTVELSCDDHYSRSCPCKPGDTEKDEDK